MQLATLQLPDTTTSAACRSTAADPWLPLPAGSLDDLLAGGMAHLRQVASQVLGGAASTVDGAAPALAAGNFVPLQPVLRPAKVICCGLNYHDHIVETGRDVPTHPTLFAKFADSLTAPTASIKIVGSGMVDWEAELAVVVGERVYRASREQAEAAILGYTVANDVSCRDWQRRTLQWFQGKAWHASSPIGPAIVTADSIDPVAGLDISCSINGQEQQRSNTRELVFDAVELVRYASQFAQLEPGDIILTGTPGGVGMGQQPPRYLQTGDVLETTIEGIGTLRNSFEIREA